MHLRDTDTDWEQLAAAEPYFSVLTHPEYLSRNLTRDGIENFYSSGQTLIERTIASLEPFRRSRKLGRGLDFGCGAGRLLIPMAKLCEQAVGVDVASRMRQITRQRADESGLANVEVFRDLDELPPAMRFDWINSRIVFQHIAPKRGYRLLEKLLSRLDVGGLVSFDFSLFRDRTLLAAATQHHDLYRVQEDGLQVLTRAQEDDPTAHMSMFDYDMNILLATFHRHGVMDMRLHTANDGGHYWVTIFGMKSRHAEGERRFAAGDVVSLDNTSGNARLLRSGFGSPEEWGVWTTAERAELVLPLSSPLTGPTSLTITANGYVPPQKNDIRVAVLVNGADCGTLHVANREPMVFVVDIPPGGTGNAELAITFHVDSPMSPSEAGEGNDFRKLGLGVRSIQVG